ncbi:hypothetical protein Y032_0228g2866 [Ancylostoma ceylanicum]|uniref:Uncharacterized protein n=1 Tax=Ancylostoma ceylanicum TaxID=53326 RepID=A0A016SH48_9BILA|nr:hypothetical protein Y032_0228g2866 [Ancylostoma ceylanicum]
MSLAHPPRGDHRREPLFILEIDDSVGQLPSTSDGLHSFRASLVRPRLPHSQLRPPRPSPGKIREKQPRWSSFRTVVSSNGESSTFL